MVDYDTENGQDTAGSETKEIKVAYNAQEQELWFMLLENRMEEVGIKSQWTKRQALIRNLPTEVITEIKNLLKKGKTAAGDRCYKDAKERILKAFGPKKEEAYYKASQLVLTGKPSELARKIVDLMCPADPPLHGCHCENFIAPMWKAQLPAPVKQAIASMEFNEAGLEAILDRADAVHATMTTPNPTVAGLTDGAQASADPNLAAFKGASAQNNRGNGRGRGQRGRGGNRNQTRSADGAQRQQNQQSGANRGPKSKDNPPDAVCQTHWKHGKSAYGCLDIASCPWKDIWIPRPKN